MGFLEDLAGQLNTAGVGVYPGTLATRTIYLEEMPDAPDAVIVLYSLPGRSGDVKNDLRQPGLHVEVRAATTGAAQTKIEAVRNALVAVVNTTLGTRYYVHVLPLGEPARLKKDDRGRTLYYCNFRIEASS